MTIDDPLFSALSLLTAVTQSLLHLLENYILDMPMLLKMTFLFFIESGNNVQQEPNQLKSMIKKKKS